jgi:hypothetical protein
MKGITLLASACLLAPAAAFAEMNYSVVEGSLVDVELDGPGNVDGDGIEIAGAYELDDRFFVLGRYQDLDLDFDIDGRFIELGAGLHHPLNDTVDFVATLTYFDSELDGPGNGSADDDGLGVSGGIRAELSPEWQVDASVKLVDTDSSGTDSAFAFGGRYYLKQNMAVSAAAEFGDDADTIKIGFRYEF